MASRTLLAVAVALSALLAGCAGGNGSPTGADPVAPGGIGVFGSGSGVLRGHVVDEDIVPIQGALVKVGTFDPLQTDVTGGFEASGLEPGTYTVQVSALGYRSLQRQVALAERVPAVEQFVLERLPTQGREMLSLMQMIPGLTPQLDAGNFEGTTYSANGRESQSSLFLVDGVHNKDDRGGAMTQVSMTIDAFSEYNVMTHHYGAEYGGASGVIVNADSAQIYRDLPILSAAPTAEDRSRADIIAASLENRGGAVLTRDVDEAVIARMEERLRALVQESNRREKCPCVLEPVSLSTPALCDPAMQQALREAAEKLAPGAWQSMPSGAGHDAQYLARVMPAAMLFTPSIGGISHHWAEDTKEEDLALCCQVLASAAARYLAA